MVILRLLRSDIRVVTHDQQVAAFVTPYTPGGSTVITEHQYQVAQRYQIFCIQP